MALLSSAPTRTVGELSTGGFPSPPHALQFFQFKRNALMTATTQAKPVEFKIIKLAPKKAPKRSVWGVKAVRSPRQKVSA